MKNLPIIFAIASTIFIMGACHSSKEIPKGDADADKEYEKFARDYEEMGRREKITVLALKYGLSDTNVEAITTEYDTRHHWAETPNAAVEWLVGTNGENHATNSEGTLEVNLNFRATIETLAQRLNIPTSTVAAVLLDYRMWVDSQQTRNED